MLLQDQGLQVREAGGLGGRGDVGEGGERCKGGEKVLAGCCALGE